LARYVSNVSTPRFLVAATLLASCHRATVPAASPTESPPASVVVPAATHTRFDGGGSDDDIALVWTANVQGYVEPCGCTAEPLGGVARWRGAVDDLRQSYGDRVLIVDAGNLLFEHLDDNRPVDLCQAEARTDLLVGQLAAAGLAITHPGPLDHVRGEAWRDQLLARHQVSALRNGVVDVRRGRHRLRVAAFDEVRADALGVHLATAWGLRNEEDAIRVVLFAGNTTQAKLVAATVPVDIIVVRDTQEAPEPSWQHPDTGAMVVAAGRQGQHLAVIEITKPSGARVLPLDNRDQQRRDRQALLRTRVTTMMTQLQEVDSDARRTFLSKRLQEMESELAGLQGPLPPMIGARALVRMVPLSRGMAEPAQAATALANHRAAIPSLVARCESSAVCPQPAEGQATYVGAAVCSACHADAFAFWQQQIVTLPGTNNQGQRIDRQVGHAKAWFTLTSEGKERDRSCVGCHSAGFNEVGGACTTTELVTKGLTGVQCESCHGPGSLHVAAGDEAARKTAIVGHPDEASCRGCHVPPHIPTVASFVVTERLRLILGVGHGEQTWRALPVPAVSP
jgi:Cytochrome c554 and c-prime